MLAAPSSESPLAGGYSSQSISIRLDNAGTSMNLIGSFHPDNGNVTGTVTQAIFQYPTDDHTALSGEITGASHVLTASEFQDFYIHGKLAEIQGLLLAKDDTIYGGSGDNALAGYSGNDILIGGLGADDLYGGTGSNTASYITAVAAVNVFMLNVGSNTGEAAGDVFHTIENLAGSNFGDLLRGDNVANVISGNGGDDGLMGYGGGDTLDGGKGTDYADYYFSSAAVTIDLASSGPQQGGEAQGDKYISIEGVYGSALGDSLSGNKGANLLNGNQGNDVLRGGKGADTLVGNIGADRFVFNAPKDSPAGGPDHILDFSHAAGDTIDLTNIDADTGKKHDQAFTFIGDETFKHHHKQHPHDIGLLRYESGVISGDVDGDRHADVQIGVNTDVVKADFLL